MTSGRPEMLEDDLCGIYLQVLCVGDDLNNSVPNFLANVISSSADELQDGVDVPLVRSGVFLREDGNLEHHLFPEAVICNLQILQKLADDDLGVVGIAHAIEKIQGSSSDTDVFVS